MNVINIPAKLNGYLYNFSYPVMDIPLYLCAEHDDEFKLTLIDDDIEIKFNGKKGFNYWSIKSSNDVNVICDKKIFNIYISYTPVKPKQFY